MEYGLFGEVQYTDRSYEHFLTPGAGLSFPNLSAGRVEMYQGRKKN